MQTIMHAPPKYCNHRVYKFLSNASKVLKNERKERYSKINRFFHLRF